MPIICLDWCSEASSPVEADCDAECVKWTLPPEGVVSSAARRSNVVFPAPFGPSNATNSPGRISSERLRKAINEPNRFSICLKDMPRLAGFFVKDAAGDADGNGDDDPDTYRSPF